MLNVIWLGMIGIGILYAFLTGQTGLVLSSAMEAGEAAVKYGIQLAGILAFWLGIMEIGQESGLINRLAKKAKPFIRLFFPSIPAEHPAAAAILMNLLANLFGMGNAATPFGLKAMGHLAELDKQTGQASDAMCTLLAINTASLTLIPTTVLGLRIAAGSQNSGHVLLAIIMTSLTGFLAAIILDRFFRFKEGRSQ